MKKIKFKSFTINDHFDLAIYENGVFAIKSKTYLFSISTLLISPPLTLIEILKEEGHEGSVLIDLLATNGSDAENRFFEAYFHNGVFEREIENGIMRKYKVNQLYLTDEEREDHDIFYSSDNIDLRGTVLFEDEIERIKSLRC